MDEPTATDSEWHNYFQSLVTGGDAPCPLDPIEPDPEAKAILDEVFDRR
jgi:hypothetical protein